ncbi:trypsin-like peptidase domain-containing protein [bacterium]|nr:trypsin-like peptidase domain-containing protein [bacterium]
MNKTFLLILSLASLAMATWTAEGAPQLDAASTKVGATFPSTLNPNLALALKLDLPPTVRNEEDLPCGGNRVGDIEPAPQGLRTSLADATWYEHPEGGSIARLELQSRGATGLRVELEDLAGMELRVYDPEGLHVLGPYVNPTLSEEGSFWSTVIFGEKIGLEFRVLPGIERPRDLPEILSVAYLFETFDRGDRWPPGGTCDEDINCYSGWAGSTEDDAVGIMFFNCDDSGCGQCTGAMLNRTNGDFAPIFMTARHCISDQATASTLIIFWEFEADVCDGTDPPLNSLPRNDGSQLLKTDYESEWTLLGLWQNSLSTAYLGWDVNYLGNGTSTTGVSHPGGMSKRISFGEKIGDDSCLGADEWLIQHDLGRTFPGASGSPLYDASRRVRGTLSCDNRECPDETSSYAEYGRMDVGYPEIRWYIYNMYSPTYVNGAVAGDPGNDGDSERGNSTQPFDTVYEGTYCIPAGGTIYIDPDTYSETFTLRRPMTLRRWGTSGTVIIGSP